MKFSTRTDNGMDLIFKPLTEVMASSDIEIHPHLDSRDILSITIKDLYFRDYLAKHSEFHDVVKYPWYEMHFLYNVRNGRSYGSDVGWYASSPDDQLDFSDHEYCGIGVTFDKSERRILKGYRSRDFKHLIPPQLLPLIEKVEKRSLRYLIRKYDF